jgi:CysZ protein
LRILLLNLLALVAALLLPGIGLILAWLIGGYAIGRGLFAAVAMRRMPRMAAEALYRKARAAVLVQGCLMALASYVPLLNLLIPVVGTAAMVHVLDWAMTASPWRL